MVVYFLLFVLAAIVLVLATFYVMIFVKGKHRPTRVFDEEEEKIRAKNYPPAFPDGWFSLCSADMVKPGQVIEVNALGKKFAVFRAKSGKVGVLDAYCPHLNANLADGCVKGDHVVCPFHGWEFKTNGQCAHIPYADKVPGNANTNAWPVEENWGVIMVWYHSKKVAPEWSTVGDVTELAEYKFHCKTSDVLRIHLQDFVENGADYAHFAHVHNLLTIPLANYFVDVKHELDLQYGGEGARHQAYFSDQADLYWKNGTKIPHAGGKAVVTFYGPGFLIFRFNTEIGKMLLIKTFTPLGPLKVRMEDYVYAPKSTTSLAVKYLLGEASTQFHDDIAIWERKSFAVRPVLVKGDGPIMKMRTWYSQFYSENQPDRPAIARILDEVELPVSIIESEQVN